MEQGTSVIFSHCGDGVDGVGEAGLAHEVFVYAARGLAAFGEGPYDQGLSARHIAGGEYARHGGHLVGGGGYVAATVEFHAKLFEQPFTFGVYEAESEQDKVNVEFELGARDLDHGGASGLVGRAPFEPYRVHLLDSAVPA